jgi:uncharacterized protein YdeI (YjbR/CyaY-like superfamily)
MAAIGAPRFFRSAAEWRKWLEKNHPTASEMVVGFHKAKSGEKGISYNEALDEALAFGWIDAVRKGGDVTWSIRFTPRKPKSIWSAVNLKRVAELTAAGRMHPAGVAVHAGRDPAQQKKYSFENRGIAFDTASAKALRADRTAWENFRKMPPSYRLAATWFVMSAGRPETKARRLGALIDDSASGRKLKHLRRPGQKS